MINLIKILSNRYIIRFSYLHESQFLENKSYLFGCAVVENYPPKFQTLKIKYQIIFVFFYSKWCDVRPVEWVPNRRMMRFYIFPWKRNRGENVAMVARSFPTCYPRIPRLFRLLYGDYWGWRTATHPPTLTYSTPLSLIRYYTV